MIKKKERERKTPTLRLPLFWTIVFVPHSFPAAFFSAFISSLHRGEENFHIFYYMYDGLADEGRTGEYFLHAHSNCRAHRYLQGYTERSSSSYNVQCFKRVILGFKMLGFRSNVRRRTSTHSSLLLCCIKQLSLFFTFLFFSFDETISSAHNFLIRYSFHSLQSQCSFFFLVHTFFP